MSAHDLGLPTGPIFAAAPDAFAKLTEKLTRDACGQWLASIPIVQCPELEPGTAYVITKKEFDPFAIKFEPILPPEPDPYVSIRYRYRPESIPWRTSIFLPSYADLYPAKPHKVSRRQAKRAKVKAALLWQHSSRFTRHPNARYRDGLRWESGAEARKVVGDG